MEAKPLPYSPLTQLSDARLALTTTCRTRSTKIDTARHGRLHLFAHKFGLEPLQPAKLMQQVRQRLKQLQGICEYLQPPLLLRTPEQDANALQH